MDDLKPLDFKSTMTPESREEAWNRFEELCENMFRMALKEARSSKLQEVENGLRSPE